MFVEVISLSDAEETRHSQINSGKPITIHGGFTRNPAKDLVAMRGSCGVVPALSSPRDDVGGRKSHLSLD
jgi:hypothetical protein